jgi:hypothetical protein
MLVRSALYSIVLPFIEPTVNMPSAIAPLEHEAKESCQQICSSIQKLPRELRDIIHSYLLLEDGIPARSYNTLNPKAPKAPRHYWSKDYIGAATLYELTETWHRSARFDFDRNLDFLPHLLAQEDSTLRCQRSQLVTKMSFKIHNDDLDVWPAADKNGIPSPRTQLLQNMENLFMLKDFARIYIFLETPPPSYSDTKNLHERQAQYLRDVMTVIFPVLLRLKEQRYKVAVVLDPWSMVRNSDGRQIWRYELRNLITPGNSSFSIDGFVKKFWQVCFGFDLTLQY